MASEWRAEFRQSVARQKTTEPGSLTKKDQSSKAARVGGVLEDKGKGI